MTEKLFLTTKKNMKKKMHGVRARTPVYFRSLKESLASICYILDRTSLLWTFRGVYNERKVVFDNNEKFRRLGHRKIIFAKDEKCQKCAWHASSITSTFSISKGSLAFVLFLDKKNYFANKERQ